MIEDSKKAYLQASWQPLYQVYFQEVASELLASRWEGVDLVVMFIVALTASGSAVAGWALWSLTGWKALWIIIAAIASVLSIAHTTLRVPSRVKDQGELRSKFCRLRCDLEAFQQDLTIGLKEDEAKERFEELQTKYSECMAATHPDILYTVSFRRKAQETLNDIWKEKGYIQ